MWPRGLGLSGSKLEGSGRETRGRSGLLQKVVCLGPRLSLVLRTPFSSWCREGPFLTGMLGPVFRWKGEGRAASQVLSAQNHHYAKAACLGVACPDPPSMTVS